ncbi:hypothetical protein FVE85_7815 [Porphyridium purpureum]|uniref:Uncharacterized protein n=1 Tax=Porphyridium purpureum TaxID=35688 RepID=A0A5J4YL31_PORPP|nr:hypothetical protein FVE85_7815 [Porphyridium purpureum]|eukprot:POR3426..scf210_14
MERVPGNTGEEDVRQVRVVDRLTDENTVKNRRTAYEHEHVVQVSAYVFNEQQPDHALEQLGGFFGPQEELAFWLLPSYARSPSAVSSAPALQKCGSDTSSSLDGSESGAEKSVRVSAQLTFI